MHKHIGLMITTAIIAVIIFVPTAADKFFALFFVGLVPFTNYTLSPSVMLVVYAALLALGIYAIARQLVTASSPVKREIESRERARKKIVHRSNKQNKQPVTRQRKHLSPATEQHTS